MPALETEQPPPKPKKFFKSRNAELYPPVPQITYAPPVPAAPLSPEHPGSAKEKKTTKRSRYNRDSSSPELPRRNSEKGKNKRNFATKASKKEEPTAENSQPPNKRYLVRNRDKVINYAEDGSNSPIPDFIRYESTPPKPPSPKASPLVASPSKSPAVTEVMSPSTSKDANEDRKPPPIVLRISKGTSRIVSTDSNEGFTSPSPDRHSSMDTHSDMGSDPKKSPAMETICSPKHEGLKITIKCAGLSQEIKKEKKKEKKEHKSHKKHHKHSEDESVKKPASPLPGSDAYDLYKTLASPTHEKEKESKKNKHVDQTELQHAKLDSDKQPKEPQPEPKPPEMTGGRSRRNRPNINYSENDDDVLSSKSRISNKQSIKTLSDLKKETKKSKRKHDTAENLTAIATVTSSEIQQGTENESESHLDKDELIDILSGNSSNEKVTHKRPHKKQKHKEKHSKHSSPSSSDAETLASIKEQIAASAEQIDEQLEENDEREVEQNDAQVEDITQEQQNDDIVSQNEANEAQIQTQSSDSAYNSCPHEFSEEESQKTHQDDVFKSPQRIDTEEHMEDKPCVKLVITKKKGSIFKSKSLMNDNASPLPARKRKHLYKHEWANDVSIFCIYGHHIYRFSPSITIMNSYLLITELIRVVTITTNKSVLYNQGTSHYNIHST